LVTGFDAKKVLAITTDPRRREEVVKRVEVPRGFSILYQLSGKTHGRIFRQLYKPAPWYVEARGALSERERLALDTLEDYQRPGLARERSFLRSEQRRYRERSNRRAGQRAPKALRAIVEQYRALLDEVFGRTRPVEDEAIKAVYLKSAGLTCAEIAALLGVESQSTTKQTPGGKPIGPELKIQKRIARERKRQSEG
jgi:hypothetical protein